MIEIDLLDNVASSSRKSTNSIEPSSNILDLNKAHQDFNAKMKSMDVDTSLSFNLNENSKNDNPLSNHLFNTYKNQKDEYAEKMNRLQDFMANEEIEMKDLFQAKKALMDIQFKSTVAIKGCEKALETCNTLLKMQ